MLSVALLNRISSPSWGKHQKRWFGKWHIYLGIIAGAIVAFVGFTGSMLVFQDEIDRALNPELFNVIAGEQKMLFAEIVPLIKQRYPDLKFDYLMDDNPENPVQAYRLFNFKTEVETFINPYTGKISGKRIYESSFIHILTELHRTLLIPVAGRYIVGLASLCLLILTISGLRLWIPKKWKQVRTSLTVKFSGSFKRQNYDWHNILGFYSSPVVALLSLTGLCITFSGFVVPLLFIFNGQSPQGVRKLLGAPSVYTAGAAQLPVKDIVEIAGKEMPGARVAAIAFPAGKTGNYRLDLVSDAAIKTGKREMLIIDQYSGKVLLNSRTDFPDIGNAYLSWLTPVHYGSFGGRPTQIIALITGLMPLTLFITGFIIWWPRFRKQKRKAAKPEAVIKHRLNVTDVRPQPAAWQHLVYNMKQGFRYALYVFLISMIMGALYGLVSGIIIQPALFTIAFSTVFVAINFAVALLVILFNIIFLAPFGKGKLILIRYFGLSLSFVIVYLSAYMLLFNTGMKIF